MFARAIAVALLITTALATTPASAQEESPTTVVLDLRLPPAHTTNGGVNINQAAITTLLDHLNSIPDEMPIAVAISAETIDSLQLAGHAETAEQIISLLNDDNITVLMTPWTSLDVNSLLAAGGDDVIIHNYQLGIANDLFPISPITLLDSPPTQATIDFLTSPPISATAIIDLTTHPSITAISLTDPLPEPPTNDLTIAEAQHYLTQRIATTHRLAAYESLRTDTTTLPLLDAQLATSASRSLTAADRLAFLASIDRQITSGTSGITIEQADRVTTFSRNTDLPLTIVNGQPVPVQVTLQFAPTTATDLTVFADPTQLTLHPGRNHFQLPVKVESSGKVQILMTSEALLLSQITAEVRLIPVAGIGALAAIAATILTALWWTRIAKRSGLLRARRPH